MSVVRFKRQRVRLQPEKPRSGARGIEYRRCATIHVSIQPRGYYSYEGRVFGIAISSTVEMIVIIVGTRTDDGVSSTLGNI